MIDQKGYSTNTQEIYEARDRLVKLCNLLKKQLPTLLVIPTFVEKLHNISIPALMVAMHEQGINYRYLGYIR
jgi:hypothetical protein